MPDPPEGPPDPFLDSSLELVGLGHDGIIYGITSDIVVKATRTHDLTGTPDVQQRHLERDHARSVAMLAKERAGLEKIGAHPNIVSAISLDYAEGLYLRRYATDIDLFLETHGTPPLQVRLGWYIAVLRALLHLHEKQLMHSDVHESNLLCDDNGMNVVLCDFPTTAIWGEIVLEKDQTVHGRVIVPFDQFDDRLDRFQSATLMLRQECGDDTKEIVTYTDGVIDLTQPVRTGNAELDVVITNGLLARYVDTRAMLDALESIAVTEGVPLDVESSGRTAEQARQEDNVAQWRTERIRTLGRRWY